jgi:hypothetical protein
VISQSLSFKTGPRDAWDLRRRTEVITSVPNTPPMPWISLRLLICLAVVGGDLPLLRKKRVAPRLEFVLLRRSRGNATTRGSPRPGLRGETQTLTPHKNCLVRVALRPAPTPSLFPPVLLVPPPIPPLCPPVLVVSLCPPVPLVSLLIPPRVLQTSGAPGVSWVLQQHGNSLVRPAAAAPSPGVLLPAVRWLSSLAVAHACIHI